jgi:hypothetical protein
MDPLLALPERRKSVSMAAAMRVLPVPVATSQRKLSFPAAQMPTYLGWPFFCLLHFAEELQYRTAFSPVLAGYSNASCHA